MFDEDVDMPDFDEIFKTDNDYLDDVFNLGDVTSSKNKKGDDVEQAVDDIKKGSLDLFEKFVKRLEKKGN